MKKVKFLIVISLLLTISLSGAWRYKTDFIATAFSLGTGGEAMNGEEFDSKELNIVGISQIALTVKFTRAAGSASTVDFAFEVSYDNGTNWATYEGVTISVATNHSVISGTSVAVLRLVHALGMSHLRLKSVVNNDGTNGLTAINVSLSY